MLEKNQFEVIIGAEADSSSNQVYQLMATYESFEERDDVRKVGRAASNATHELVFAVKQLNLDTLERY